MSASRPAGPWERRAAIARDAIFGLVETACWAREASESGVAFGAERAGRNVGPKSTALEIMSKCLIFMRKICVEPLAGLSLAGKRIVKEL